MSAMTPESEACVRLFREYAAEDRMPHEWLTITQDTGRAIVAALDAAEARAERAEKEAAGHLVALRAAKYLLGSSDTTHAAFVRSAVEAAEAKKDAEIESHRACNATLTADVERLEAALAAWGDAWANLSAEPCAGGPPENTVYHYEISPDDWDAFCDAVSRIGVADAAERGQ